MQPLRPDPNQSKSWSLRFPVFTNMLPRDRCLSSLSRVLGGVSAARLTDAGLSLEVMRGQPVSRLRRAHSTRSACRRAGREGRGCLRVGAGGRVSSGRFV